MSIHRVRDQKKIDKDQKKIRTRGSTKLNKDQKQFALCYQGTRGPQDQGTKGPPDQGTRGPRTTGQEPVRTRAPGEVLGAEGNFF